MKSDASLCAVDTSNFQLFIIIWLSFIILLLLSGSPIKLCSILFWWQAKKCFSESVQIFNSHRDEMQISENKFEFRCRKLEFYEISLAFIKPFNKHHQPPLNQRSRSHCTLNIMDAKIIQRFYIEIHNPGSMFKSTFICKIMRHSTWTLVWTGLPLFYNG